MGNRFIFDKEFEEKLNAVNKAAYRYFKIKSEYDEAEKELHLLLNKQKENNGESVQFLK